jgi:hypothetical protein
VPGEVLAEAERLECLLFAGYDPHFEGDETPWSLDCAGTPLTLTTSASPNPAVVGQPPARYPH